MTSDILAALSMTKMRIRTTLPESTKTESNDFNKIISSLTYNNYILFLFLFIFLFLRWLNLNPKMPMKSALLALKKLVKLMDVQVVLVNNNVPVGKQLRKIPSLKKYAKSCQE
jgi:hypothetical protein